MKKNKKIIYLLLIVFLLKFSKQQDHDQSFADFCTASGGRLSSVSGLTVQTQGDGCVGSTFGGVIVNDKEEGKQFCIKFGPYHFVEAHVDASGVLTCDYESLHVCRIGYKQIRGRCYRIANSRRTVQYNDAQAICDMEGKEEKDQVYSHYSDEIGHFIRAFFADLSAVWTSVPKETILDVKLDIEKGVNYAVLYGTADVYGAGYVSLAKIPEDHVAMVLCEYIPQETFRSLQAKMKKFAEYLPPMVLDNSFWVWRTYNYYQPKNLNIHDTYFESHQNECKESLKVFMPTKHVKLFNPTIERMKQVGTKLKEHAIFVAPFRQCNDNWCSVAFKWTGGQSSCWEQSGRSSKASVYKGCIYSCDSGSRAPRMYYDPTNGDYNFYYTTASIHAPMLCDVNWDAYRRVNAECDAGWTKVDRKDGTRACHLYVKEGLERDQARDYCQKHYNAYLGGWRSVEELNIIRSFGEGWVSLRRNVDCPDANEIAGHQCHYDNIFFDPDEMSDNSLAGRQIHRSGLCKGQPSNTGLFEYCMTFAHGSCLHDYNCDSIFYFTCTKIAPKIEQG